MVEATQARVAELADAEDSKSFDLTVVWVQVPPRVLLAFSAGAYCRRSFGWLAKAQVCHKFSFSAVLVMLL